MSNTRKSLASGKMNVVGKNIENVRLSKNLSRQELSNQLMIKGIDLSGQVIYKIETGMRTITDYELCAIAEILKMSVDELLKDFKEYLKNESD